MASLSSTISRRTFFTTLAGAALAARVRADETPFPEAADVVPVRLPGPAGWAGRKLLFVTDLHYGHHFGAPEAAALNTLVRREKPDLVLMGGDLGHERTTPLDGFFAAWSPGCPTVFAAGNHDSGFGGPSWVERQAERHGLVLLRNRLVRWNDLTIIGLPSALCAAQRRSLVQAPGFKLVLAHEPDTWDWTAGRDFVQLAGHTHGGQIRLLGRPVCLPTLGIKYPLGTYTRPGTRLIVSAGIGCTGPAIRLNCPPEICRIELV